MTLGLLTTFLTLPSHAVEPTTAGVCLTPPASTPTTPIQNQAIEQLACQRFFEGDARSNPHFIPPQDRSTEGRHLDLNSNDARQILSRYSGSMGSLNLARDSASCLAGYGAGAVRELGSMIRGLGTSAEALRAACEGDHPSIGRRMANGLLGPVMCTGIFTRMLENNYGSVSGGLRQLAIEAANCNGAILGQLVLGGPTRLPEACEHNAIYQEMMGRMTQAFAMTVRSLERSADGTIESFACLNPAAKARQVCSAMGHFGALVASTVIGPQGIRTLSRGLVSAVRASRAEATGAEILSHIRPGGPAMSSVPVTRATAAAEDFSRLSTVDARAPITLIDDVRPTIIDGPRVSTVSDPSIQIESLPPPSRPPAASAPVSGIRPVSGRVPTPSGPRFHMEAPTQPVHRPLVIENVGSDPNKFLIRADGATPRSPIIEEIPRSRTFRFGDASGTYSGESFVLFEGGEEHTYLQFRSTDGSLFWRRDDQFLQLIRHGSRPNAPPPHIEMRPLPDPPPPPPLRELEIQSGPLARPRPPTPMQGPPVQSIVPVPSMELPRAGAQ